MGEGWPGGGEDEEAVVGERCADGEGSAPSSEEEAVVGRVTRRCLRRPYMLRCWSIFIGGMD